MTLVARTLLLTTPCRERPSPSGLVLLLAIRLPTSATSDGASSLELLALVAVSLGVLLEVLTVSLLELSLGTPLRLIIRLRFLVLPSIMANLTLLPFPPDTHDTRGHVVLPLLRVHAARPTVMTGYTHNTRGHTPLVTWNTVYYGESHTATLPS